MAPDTATLDARGGSLPDLDAHRQPKTPLPARALGARFDARAFHRQILIDGPLPLGVLEAKVRAWIRAEAAR